VKFKSFVDNTSSRVMDKLKAIRLSSRQTELERVRTVNFRVNKRSIATLPACSSLMNSFTNTSYATNIVKRTWA